MGRWRRHLDPTIRRDSWAPHEDQALVDLYQQFGSQWSQIALAIPGRTAQQCRARCAAAPSPLLRRWHARQRASGLRSSMRVLASSLKACPQWSPVRLQSLSGAGHQALRCRRYFQIEGPGEPVRAPRQRGKVRGHRWARSPSDDDDEEEEEEEEVSELDEALEEDELPDSQPDEDSLATSPQQVGRPAAQTITSAVDAQARDHLRWTAAGCVPASAARLRVRLMARACTGSSGPPLKQVVGAQVASPESDSFQAMGWRSKKRRRQAARPAQGEGEPEAAAQAALQELASPARHAPRRAPLLQPGQLGVAALEASASLQ